MAQEERLPRDMSETQLAVVLAQIGMVVPLSMSITMGGHSAGYMTM